MNNCFVAYNYSKDNGGGIMFSTGDNGNGIIQNTLIANNTSDGWGVEICVFHSQGTKLVNNTFAYNSAGSNGLLPGGAIYCSSCSDLKIQHFIWQSIKPIFI